MTTNHDQELPDGLAEDLLLLGTMVHVLNERQQSGRWCTPCLDRLNDELVFYISQQRKGTVQ